MSDVVTAGSGARAELLAVEARRRRALIEVDMPALDELYDESLVHIHAPGLIHTKAQLMEHVATRRAYLDIIGDEPTIRLVGDVAVVTGRVVNRLRNPDDSERVVGGAVTQVLRRCVDGRWRLISFQMTPDGEQVWPALPSELDEGGKA